MLNNKRDGTVKNIFANRESIFKKVENIRNGKGDYDIRKDLVDER
jgi:hypothetical protein